MSDKELTELREEIARLRERVAVLESRPTPPAQPLYIGPARDPYAPPYTVTCESTP